MRSCERYTRDCETIIEQLLRDTRQVVEGEKSRMGQRVQKGVIEGERMGPDAVENKSHQNGKIVWTKTKEINVYNQRDMQLRE